MVPLFLACVLHICFCVSTICLCSNSSASAANLANLILSSSSFSLNDFDPLEDFGSFDVSEFFCFFLMLSFCCHYMKPLQHSSTSILFSSLKKYLVVNLIKSFISLNPGFIFQDCIMIFMSTQQHFE